MHRKEGQMTELTEERINQINWEMAEAALAYIRSALSHFGVPPSTFADDQFDNFVAMYNRRGEMMALVDKENGILRDRLRAMEEVLVTVANWPNPDKHEAVQSMKVWAASVVDPYKVDMLRALTNQD